MNFIFVAALLVFNFALAGITTPDDFNIRFEQSSPLTPVKDLATGRLFKPTIAILDGGSLYSGNIFVEIVRPTDHKLSTLISDRLKNPMERLLYAIPLEADGSLSHHNQRILAALVKVASGELTLKQIHFFDGKVIKAGDFSYKVIAAVNVGN